MSSILEAVSKGTTRIRINLGNLKNLRICLPPINEQQEVAEHISKFSTKINVSINLIKSKIKLLTEYRTALISAAVTGKIDVSSL